MERQLHPRVPSTHSTTSNGSPEIHQRPYPFVRTTSNNTEPSLAKSPSSPRLAPLLPQNSLYNGSKGPTINVSSAPDDNPSICGLPLKYVSLVTLAVQNAALSIVMHYSRVSTPPSLSYSPASAVLLNEMLKGSISFVIALARVKSVREIQWSELSIWGMFLAFPWPWSPSFRQLCNDIFSPDCWKLSIPAILYVIQNSLQFVAVSNLPVASFQVTYQMKILTTAAFSVLMLRKRLSTTKWLSLFVLALGVAIVQIQTSKPKPVMVGSAHQYAHVMSPLKGFGAVTAACITSGAAGVYFEMVLKGSKADLWVRNVQLSLFSLVPALLPILYQASPPQSEGWFLDLFRNFGGWAWATVFIQVAGGLVTAVVIKYSDNILKGFATSLSIIISSLASVVLFDFQITPSFIVGSSTVLAATWMYNQPAAVEPPVLTGQGGRLQFPGSPVENDAPIIGQARRKSSTRSFASALGLSSGMDNNGTVPVDMSDTKRYLEAPYGSPFATPHTSRNVTPYPSRPPSPNTMLGPLDAISRRPSEGGGPLNRSLSSSSAR